VRPHVLAELAKARKTIDVAMYAFTDSDLAWALVKAHERGIRVRVFLDSGQGASKYAKGRFFARRGLAARYYHGAGIMHHKFAVIDQRVVITGSYNWTASAEKRNREDLLIIADQRVASAYQREFERLWRDGLGPP
jgi:phosphatidylserine/phosphatidylglycerophosphate/cardiolipin synthase-like enzyme